VPDPSIPLQMTLDTDQKFIISLARFRGIHRHEHFGADTVPADVGRGTLHSGSEIALDNGGVIRRCDRAFKTVMEQVGGAKPCFLDEFGILATEGRKWIPRYQVQPMREVVTKYHPRQRVSSHISLTSVADAIPGAKDLASIGTPAAVSVTEAQVRPSLVIDLDDEMAVIGPAA
jgi:hypothetical protein